MERHEEYDDEFELTEPIESDSQAVVRLQNEVDRLSKLLERAERKARGEAKFSIEAVITRTYIAEGYTSTQVQEAIRKDPEAFPYTNGHVRFDWTEEL